MCVHVGVHLYKTEKCTDIHRLIYTYEEDKYILGSSNTTIVSLLCVIFSIKMCVGSTHLKASWLAFPVCNGSPWPVTSLFSERMFPLAVL